jgi:hypothetical protein
MRGSFRLTGTVAGAANTNASPVVALGSSSARSGVRPVMLLIVPWASPQLPGARDGRRDQHQLGVGAVARNRSSRHDPQLSRRGVKFRSPKPPALPTPLGWMLISVPGPRCTAPMSENLPPQAHVFGPFAVGPLSRSIVASTACTTSCIV